MARLGLPVPRLLIPVFFISWATIGWQLALMRCLHISRYHHFSFLVISCALLGFGAAGVVLSLKRAWCEQHASELFRWGLLCFALSLPACLRLGELLPLQVYFAPNVLVSTIAWWSVFWGIHSVPFFIAGFLVGLALITAGARVHVMYGANLAGSAAGALGTVLLMHFVPPNGLVLPLSMAVLLSGLSLLGSVQGRRDWLFLACLALPCLGLGAVWSCAKPDQVFPLTIDQYKPLAHVMRLEHQGSCKREATLYGPRARLDVFSGPSFHTLLSLSPVESPPRMSVVMRDGFEAGALLSITSTEQARFLDTTLSALPYRLVRPKRVLILGETGGIAVWLARRSAAERIVVVQPDPNVARILETYGNPVLADPRVRMVVSEPRAFLDSTDQTFDIIHLSGLEGFSAGSTGIGGLREDYLATVQGFGTCLKALSPTGVACVVRGIQEPERDNLKIAATWIEALERRGVDHPADCMLMARDELAMATLVSPSPIDQRLVAVFRGAAQAMSWETEWFPGVKPEETNRVHVLPGPPGQTTSWHHYAMIKMLGREREDFYRQWMCNVRPGTDDRPFFYDFFLWRSLTRLREVFGPLWPTRAEMGFLVLVLSAVMTAVAAGLLLPAPVLLLGKREVSGSWSVATGVVLYFGALGAGFMFVEMALIQMFTRFLGDPVPAAALVLGGLLLFAGMGSMVQPAVTARIRGGAVFPTLGVAFLMLGYSQVLPCLFEAESGLADSWKVATGLIILAPPAFLMGMPFPWGLSVLRTDAIPVGWAVNGFASVVSASLAVLLAMSFGFTAVLESSAAMYTVAAIGSSMLHQTGKGNMGLP